MAAPIYAEFDTTPANAAADIKTKILTQSDWASLTGSGLTSCVKATTTRGAQMVVDFADVAATAVRMQLGLYRTHDGTTGVDKAIRYLTVRSTGGATTDPWHVVVSASKEHLYVSVEGPRSGEPNPVATDGSLRQLFFLGDLLPYFATDAVPAVVCVGQSNSSSGSNVTNCWVSRNAVNTASWVSAYLGSVCAPISSISAGANRENLPNQAAADSNCYLWPYVVVENTAGLRGRLANTFFVCWNVVDGPDPIFAPGQKFSYAGGTYIAVTPHKGSLTTAQTSAFGQAITTSGTSYASAVIAVPSP